MRAVVVYNEERKNLAEREMAKRIAEEIKKQGLTTSIDAASFANPLCGYYDSFPRLSTKALTDADIVVVLGGDGTKNYVANQLIQQKNTALFIGIPIGTHNVGKLNTARASAVGQLTTYQKRELSAIKVTIGEDTYYAFHDVIFASTFVSGLNGKITQLSARAIMENKQIPEPPQFIGGHETTVCVMREDGRVTKMPLFEPLGLISSAELSAYPKYMVMSGAANHPINIGAQSGIILSGERLVWPDRTLNEYCCAEPILTAFASYSGKDIVYIAGLAENTYLILDGNAVCPVYNKRITLENCMCFFSVLDNRSSIT